MAFAFRLLSTCHLLPLAADRIARLQVTILTSTITMNWAMY